MFCLITCEFDCNVKQILYLRRFVIEKIYLLFIYIFGSRNTPHIERSLNTGRRAVTCQLNRAVGLIRPQVGISRKKRFKKFTSLQRFLL